MDLVLLKSLIVKQDWLGTNVKEKSRCARVGIWLNKIQSLGTLFSEGISLYIGIKVLWRVFNVVVGEIGL